MYKVLLVDDEIAILEGIASTVDWASCQTELVFKAYNGREAFDYISREKPDIVLTDVKMPGMNGIELIQKVHHLFPDIKFIVLSGHDEFEFAKTAMECNVKHYLLKPSNETKIEEVLKKITTELNELRGKEAFITNMRRNLQRVIPQAKEQFLRDLLINHKYLVHDWDSYRQLFQLDVDGDNFRIVVISVDGEHDYEHVFAIKELLMEEMGKEHPVLLTTIGEKVVMMSKCTSLEQLFLTFSHVKESFHQIYHLTFTTAVSHTGTIDKLKSLYKEALNCLAQRFYLSEGSVITSDDITHDESEYETFQLDHEELIFSIKSGNVKQVQDYLEKFFKAFKIEQYNENIVKSECLELFLTIIKQSTKDQLDQYFEQITFFHSSKSFEEIKAFIEYTTTQITQDYYEKTKQTQNAMLKLLITYVDEHLSDPDLSLTKIANEILYMNPDYVGKLFKKEMNEKFSTYLINKRVDKAIELINQSDQVKVIEIAEEVGFGTNPRYFGQVFKKHTGVTPTEYKSKLISS
ncbi:response regulator transcription factor [Bacillus sp. PS06]|uniref:response regulator transcription factor n=1 Tax=Bacillus sp. PS06 TaxID=2764176 RepID=UPI0017822335|nr:response regulator [Bacillus sp. PS06]MBD8071144.1 response regulator [Bacillus sp. PS06]